MFRAPSVYGRNFMAKHVPTAITLRGCFWENRPHCHKFGIVSAPFIFMGNLWIYGSGESLIVSRPSLQDCNFAPPPLAVFAKYLENRKILRCGFLQLFMKFIWALGKCFLAPVTRGVMGYRGVSWTHPGGAILPPQYFFCIFFIKVAYFNGAWHRMTKFDKKQNCTHWQVIMTSLWRHYDVTGIAWRDIGKTVVKSAKMLRFGQITPHFLCSWARKLDFWHCRALRGQKHCFSIEKTVKCYNSWNFWKSADVSTILTPSPLQITTIFKMKVPLSNSYKMWGQPTSGDFWVKLYVGFPRAVLFLGENADRAWKKCWHQQKNWCQTNFFGWN